MTQPYSEYSCLVCRDQEGFFFRDESGFEFWKDCECVKKRISEKLIKASQITEEFQSKTFSTFDNQGLHAEVEQARSLAYEYTIEFTKIRHRRQNSIALLGQPGSGKTHLLMAVSNNLIKKGIEVIYFPWVEGWTEISEDYKLMPERVRRLQRAEVLFIDDVYKGRDEPTKTQREQFFAIINYRYMENLPILISSERDIAQMCEFDEGVGSRINEMCKSYKAIIEKNMQLNRRLQ